MTSSFSSKDIWVVRAGPEVMILIKLFIDNAEKSNEERNKFHIDTGNTSNEVETVPKGDYLYFIPTYMILYSN